MEMITPNVYTETKIRGCNPSIVFTSEGSVFIDTAQWLSTLLEMREFAKKRGPIRYLINTEAHIDHIFGNHWFAGESLVVGHENLKNIFWTVADDKPCYEYSVDVLERQDPAALPLMPSQEDYIVNYPQITYSDRMTLKVGDTDFFLYYTPGHSDAQSCVHVPKERVAFVGDTIFSGCQTWLHSADIDALLKSLDFLETLEDVDYIVPGHGPVVTKDYIPKQRAFIYEWIAAVAKGVEKGWDLDECIANISFADRFPMDIGQEETMGYVQRTNVIKCYHYLTHKK